jgi:hypothetical protein
MPGVEEYFAKEKDSRGPSGEVLNSAHHDSRIEPTSSCHEPCNRAASQGKVELWLSCPPCAEEDGCSATGRDSLPSQVSAPSATGHSTADTESVSSRSTNDTSRRHMRRPSVAGQDFVMLRGSRRGSLDGSIVDAMVHGWKLLMGMS